MTTTTRTHRAPRALFPLAMAGALSALAVAPTAAFADDTNVPATTTTTVTSGAFTATYAGAGVGYNNVLDGHAAGTVKLQVEDGDAIEAFCIEFAKKVAETGTYTAKTYDASGVTSVAKAADIAVNHNGVEGQLTDPRAENAAAQLAIWRLTDGVNIGKVPNAEIVARARALVKAATAHTEAASSLVLTSTAEVSGKGAKAKDTVEATVKTDAGTPVAGQVVTFTVGDQTLTSTTDENGLATVKVDAPETEVDMAVSIESIAPAGTVLVPEGKQAMVTTADAKVTRTGTVALPVEPTPTKVEETPSPVPTPDHTDHPKPDPKPDPKVNHQAEPQPKQLPHTGGWATVGMLAAALGVTGAGFLGRRLAKRR